MPFAYALEQLAQRWGVPPWALDTPPPDIDPAHHLDWLLRGLEYQRLEGSVRHG